MRLHRSPVVRWRTVLSWSMMLRGPGYRTAVPEKSLPKHRPADPTSLGLCPENSRTPVRVPTCSPSFRSEFRHPLFLAAARWLFAFLGLPGTPRRHDSINEFRCDTDIAERIEKSRDFLAGNA